jgi:flagellar hook assembly protein FlgD
VAIDFGLQSVSISSADILDASGRLIRRIAGTPVGRGSVNLVWDGKDERGRETPGGVYMVRAVTTEGIRTGTLVRTR